MRSFRSSIRRVLGVIACALAPSACSTMTDTTYRAVTLDSAGILQIAAPSGRVIRPAKDSDQIGFAQPELSPDRRAVGWLALYPNCCTTYPIPLALMLLRFDGSRVVIRNDLPIWRWAFAPDGQSIVLRQSPVHGAELVTFEQHDIRTGRVLATAQMDSAHSVLPAWIPPALRGEP